MTDPRPTQQPAAQPAAPTTDGAGFGPVEWRHDDRPVPYPEAIQEMEARVAAILAGQAPQLVWLLEHPPLYTAGTSARPEDLRDPSRFPVFPAGRGGQYTYHGPGQRIGYAMLDLRRRGRDVRCFVRDLEEWVIRALARFNVTAERHAGRIGVWVARPDKGPGHQDKIAAIGVRVRRWVTFHGISINLDPDLEHFSGIVPCGVDPLADPRLGVTSLGDLGIVATMPELDMALAGAFAEVFGGSAASDVATCETGVPREAE